MSARSFSLPTTFRMVPNELLRVWFDMHVRDEFDPDWDSLRQREVDPLIEFITDLPVRQSVTMESDLQAVFDLASNQGMTAIAEAAMLQGKQEVLDQIPDCLNLYGRSMWLRVHAPDIHSAAWALFEVDTLSYFRRRNDVPDRGVESPIDAEACETLARAVSNMLKTEGRGQQCSIETLRRGDIDHYTVHADDWIRCDQFHDDNGALDTHAIRPTTQVTFKYNRVEGWLELAASGMKLRHKEELERLFAAHVLGWKLPPFEKQEAFQLDHLIDESFRLVTDPVDQIRVRVCKMKVHSPATARDISLWVRPGDPNDTIHDAIKQQLNLENISLDQAEVREAVIEIEFMKTQSRNYGRQRITVRSPNTCNLRGARPERVEIFQKHLKLWKIDRAESAQPDRVQVGA